MPASYGPAAQPLRDDDFLYLGKAPDGSFARGFPPALKVDLKLLERGRDRFTIYCSPCHGAVGDGNGITKKYGMGATPTYHDDRLRKMAEGEIFNTITNGKGQMNPYADKLTAGRPLGRDRLRARPAAGADRHRGGRAGRPQGGARNQMSEARLHARPSASAIAGHRRHRRSARVRLRRAHVATAWLVGIGFWTAIAIGMLMMILIHHIFDASWSIVLRRQYEHGLAAFPWLALLFLPLILASCVRRPRPDLALDEPEPP